MSYEDDLDDLSPEQLEYINKVSQNPVSWAEVFLTEPKLNQPFKANYIQRLIMEPDAKDVWACIHRRAGKMQPLDSTVYTPEGPKKMGDLQVGELVCTPDGTAVEIKKVIPQSERDVYKFTLSDGSTVESGDNHDWVVYTNLKWQGTSGDRRKILGYKKLTTKEISKNYIYSYNTSKGKPRVEYRYKLPAHNPVYYTEKTLKDDPYVLGRFLGGDSSAKIQEEVHNNCYSKFIPEEYLRGSIEQRTHLLQGILDSTGYADKRRRGQAEVTTASKQFANDLVELGRSLGCVATVSSRRSFYTKKGQRVYTGPKYRVRVVFPEGLEVFREKTVPGLPKDSKCFRRSIINVEFLGRKPCQCITIDDPRHLYLTDGFAPTHNCISGDSLIIHPDTLKPTPICEASDVTRTLVFDFSSNKTVWSACEWRKSGYKRCIRLVLGSGVDLTLTPEHLVFESKRGWIPAGNLSPGCRIVAPSLLEVEGTREYSKEEVKELFDDSTLNKRISDEVFSCNKESLIRFLTTFWLNNGRFHHDGNVVSLFTDCREIALGLKHLLLRFEVDSRIDEDHIVWVDDIIDVRVFLNVVGVDAPIIEVKSPRRWEPVYEIQDAGFTLVYDLCVEHEDHNFIANDLIVHNSYALSVLALWHAVTKIRNDIVVLAPSQKQVDEVFDNLRRWISANEILRLLQAKTGSHKQPQRITFENDSTIRGFPLGIGSNIEEGLRGLSPRVIIVDEAHLLEDKDWDVIDPMIRGDQYSRDLIKAYIVGTAPNSPTGKFFNICYGPEPPSKNTVRIFVPITQNKDPYFTPEVVEELRQEINDQYRWRKEYLLEVSESQSSVFRKQDIEVAFSGDYEYGSHLIDNHEYRYIGVDWDKSQAGTNIVVCQYNPIRSLAKVIWREEVPKSEFVYLEAMKRILDLFQEFNPHRLLVDHGQGQVQFELLQAFGLKHPELALWERTEKVDFSSRIEIEDPVTREPQKKMLKPFLVGLQQKAFEDQKIIFSKHDDQAKLQYFEYKVIRETEKTVVYSRENEHIIDCVSFCFYGIMKDHDPIWRAREVDASVIVYRPDAIPPEQAVAEYQTLWENLDLKGREARVTDAQFVPRSNFTDPIDDIPF